jgi:hypothetical protein
MITLPVTPQMYHSLVQQQIPNSDNTVCVTPMQVQNFVSSNSLCGSITNSNLNTTYIMTANNRNVINMPLQPSSGSIKTVIQNPASMHHIYSPKSRTIVRKTYMKKRILSLPAPRLKLSPQEELKKPTTNNNSSNVKNKNPKVSQMKSERLQTSQSKSQSKNDKSEPARLDACNTKVKSE